jgi:hypothetical protein
MEAGHLRENPETPQQQETSSNHLRLQNADAPFLAANNQVTRRNQRIRS